MRTQRVQEALERVGSPIPEGKIRTTCNKCGEQFLAGSVPEAQLLMSAHPCSRDEIA
jgi:hypothetical protein